MTLNTRELATSLVRRIYYRIFKDKNIVKMSPEKMEQKKRMAHEYFVQEAKSLASIAAHTILNDENEKKQIDEDIQHVNISMG